MENRILFSLILFTIEALNLEGVDFPFVMGKLACHVAQIFLEGCDLLFLSDDDFLLFRLDFLSILWHFLKLLFEESDSILILASEFLIFLLMGANQVPQLEDFLIFVFELFLEFNDFICLHVQDSVGLFEVLNLLFVALQTILQELNFVFVQ